MEWKKSKKSQEILALAVYARLKKTRKDKVKILRSSVKSLGLATLIGPDQADQIRQDPSSNQSDPARSGQISYRATQLKHLALVTFALNLAIFFLNFNVTAFCEKKSRKII